MPVYCSFLKSLFSPRSHQPLFRNSLLSVFFCFKTFETYIFKSNSTFVAETHFYTEQLTSNFLPPCIQEQSHTDKKTNKFGKIADLSVTLFFQNMFFFQVTVCREQI